MRGHVHVIGAGLAGLAAALDLGEACGRVTLHEASSKAGGRCRSYHDAVLGRRIDNGNHLILSGNAAVLDHARRIGAADRLRILPEAAFPFADLSNGSRWTVRLPRTPLDVLKPDALPPGASLRSALGGVLALLAAGADRTVAEVVRDRGTLWRTFWEPLAVAILNMPPERGSAALLRAALLRSFLRGAAACRPVIATEGLGAALVDPALERLREKGVELRLRRPLARVVAERGRVTGLAFGDGTCLRLGDQDGVVLAVPPAALAGLLPGLSCPGPGSAILNAHFRVSPGLAAGAPLLGVLGGQAQWVFRRDDVLSVTVSAAEALPVWSMSRDEALALLWSDVSRALGLGAAAPIAQRLLRERAATFDQSPRGAALRPATRTDLRNLVLAGDHVRTGLPATLEGAVISGRRAAAAVLSA